MYVLLYCKKNGQQQEKTGLQKKYESQVTVREAFFSLFGFENKQGDIWGAAIL